MILGNVLSINMIYTCSLFAHYNNKWCCYMIAHKYKGRQCLYFYCFYQHETYGICYLSLLEQMHDMVKNVLLHDVLPIHRNKNGKTIYKKHKQKKQAFRRKYIKIEINNNIMCWLPRIRETINLHFILDFCTKYVNYVCIEK